MKNAPTLLAWLKSADLAAILCDQSVNKNDIYQYQKDINVYGLLAFQNMPENVQYALIMSYSFIYSPISH